MAREKARILTRRWLLMSFLTNNLSCSSILVAGQRITTLKFLPIRGNILSATRGNSRSRELCMKRMFLRRARIIMTPQFCSPTPLWMPNQQEGIKSLCFRLSIRRDGLAKGKKIINTRIFLIRLPLRTRDWKSDRHLRINLTPVTFQRAFSMGKVNGRKMITMQGQYLPLIK